MAATNINRVVLTGNLTRDPELRSTPGGTSVCSLRLASNTRRKDGASGEWVDKPNYFSVTVWGAQGENCSRFLTKGRGVCIDGRLEWREWQDQSGNKREAVEIVADSVQFLGARDAETEPSASEPKPEPAARRRRRRRHPVLIRRGGSPHGRPALPLRAMTITSDNDSTPALAALRYASMGWRVLPLHTPTPAGCSCGHADCANPGQAPAAQARRARGHQRFRAHRAHVATPAERERGHRNRRDPRPRRRRDRRPRLRSRDWRTSTSRCRRRPLRAPAAGCTSTFASTGILSATRAPGCRERSTSVVSADTPSRPRASTPRAFATDGSAAASSRRYRPGSTRCCARSPDSRRSRREF